MGEGSASIDASSHCAAMQRPGCAANDMPNRRNDAFHRPRQSDRSGQNPTFAFQHRTPTNSSGKAVGRGRTKTEVPARGYLAGTMKPAVTYFPAEQYHRRQGLNCCVRDGNRCFPLSVFTGNSVGGLSAADGLIA